MSTSPDFEDYLRSKKIDSARFKEAEPDLWASWKREFEQMHPNSFTVQKLNLINPVRRKYQLQQEETREVVSQAVPAQPVVKPGRPVIKPKRD